MAELEVGDRLQADQQNMFTDGDLTKPIRRVRDQSAIDALNAIAAALGAATNTVPSIFNVSAPTPGTEYSQALPPNTKRFMIKTRGVSSIKLTYASAAADFLTIPGGSCFSDLSFYSGQTLYFKLSQADVVEIVAYV